MIKASKWLIGAWYVLTNSDVNDVWEKFAIGKRRRSPDDSEVVGTSLGNRHRRHGARDCSQQVTSDFIQHSSAHIDLHQGSRYG